jgi:hypothetical protein
MDQELVGDGDIEITRAQNRNFLLGEGFHRMAMQSNAWSLALRYHAQSERHYRRAIEEFERLKALRPELPNEPILETQPEPKEDTCPLSELNPFVSEAPLQPPISSGVEALSSSGGLHHGHGVLHAPERIQMLSATRASEHEDKHVDFPRRPPSDRHLHIQSQTDEKLFPVSFQFFESSCPRRAIPSPKFVPYPGTEEFGTHSSESGSLSRGSFPGNPAGERHCDGRSPLAVIAVPSPSRVTWLAGGLHSCFPCLRRALCASAAHPQPYCVQSPFKAG